MKRLPLHLERRSGHMTPATPHQDSGQIPVSTTEIPAALLMLVKHDMVVPPPEFP